MALVLLLPLYLTEKLTNNYYYSLKMKTTVFSEALLRLYPLLMERHTADEQLTQQSSLISRDDHK